MTVSVTRIDLYDRQKAVEIVGECLMDAEEMTADDDLRVAVFQALAGARLAYAIAQDQQLPSLGALPDFLKRQ